MPSRSKFLAGVLVLAGLLSGCSDSSPSASPFATAPSMAKGGGGGGGGGGGVPVATRCATITVTNNGQSVRRSVMPDIKYNLENCGTDPITVTVTIAETAGFLSVLCPSPVAPPATFSLAARQKLSATAPVFRGPCGFSSNVNGVPVPGINAFQGHNLLLTLGAADDGTVFGSAPFSWQDILNAGL